MNSLKKLKEKLQQQRKHLDELDKHISELVRGQCPSPHHPIYQPNTILMVFVVGI
jgi:hypothetical protein